MAQPLRRLSRETLVTMTVPDNEHQRGGTLTTVGCNQRLAEAQSPVASGNFRMEVYFEGFLTQGVEQ